MKTDDLDVVYIVREGDDNEELRYSLRSIAANLPHRRVVIAGHKPDWVRGVLHIPTDQASQRTKYAKAMLNWKAAVNDDYLSENFVLFNDDFYVMQPLEELPIYHRGPINNIIDHYNKLGGPYVANMKRTRKLLKDLGADNLLSYALHIPMVVNKTRYKFLLGGLEAAGYDLDGVQLRSLYGNFWRLGGEYREDVKYGKATDVPNPDSDFLSTLDESFNDGITGKLIRQTFTEKCRYER
jgi:hypothetical protein